MKGPTVRFNIECVSVKHVPVDVESFAYGESFAEAIEDVTQSLNRTDKNASGEWNKTYYYTNEDTGYYFYTKEDMEYVEEDEK